MAKHFPEKLPKNIIVRMPNWIGDLVMATPILQDLRRQYPHAKITAMCQKNVATLLEADPSIDEILRFERPSRWIHRTKHFEIIESIRRGKYDLGILLTNSFSSAWWFYRGHVESTVGFSANLRSFLLTHPVPFPKEKEYQHLVITYKMLLVPLGIAISDSHPQLNVTEKEMEDAKQTLARCGVNYGKHTIVGMNPGAAYGTAKCWPPENFIDVSKKLLENPDVCLVFFGDQSQKELTDSICKKLPNRCLNLAGKTSIRELMALISLLSILLTNDSGPMHMASALNIPLLALFGSTSDVKTGPYKAGNVIHKHVECSPCYKRVCPIDFRCMRSITPDEVFLELKKLIKNK